MLQTYHRQICQQALESFFSPRALAAIIQANLGQDALRYQHGHPHFHFDDNAFETGNRYIAEQFQIALGMIQTGKEPALAWQAFGRLTHTAQDFYAHSNYIRLWATSHPERELPPPAQVAALDPSILQHPDLCSGKIYLWDWLSYVPGCYSLAYRLAPPDSHTRMNLDSPQQGTFFQYALAAAVKRTVYQYELIAGELGNAELGNFTDR